MSTHARHQERIRRRFSELARPLIQNVLCLPNGMRVRLLARDDTRDEISEYRRDERERLIRALRMTSDQTSIVVVGPSGSGKTTTVAQAVCHVGGDIRVVEFFDLNAQNAHGARVINLTLVDPRDHQEIKKRLRECGLMRFRVLVFDYKPLSERQQRELQERGENVVVYNDGVNQNTFLATTLSSAGVEAPRIVGVDWDLLRHRGQALADRFGFELISRNFGNPRVRISDQHLPAVAFSFLNERHRLDDLYDLKESSGIVRYSDILEWDFMKTGDDLPVPERFYLQHLTTEWLTNFLSYLGVTEPEAVARLIKNIYLAENNLGASFARGGFIDPRHAADALRVYVLANLLYQDGGKIFDWQGVVTRTAIGAEHLPKEIYDNEDLEQRYEDQLPRRQISMPEETQAFIARLWDEVVTRFPEFRENPAFQLLRTGVVIPE